MPENSRLRVASFFPDSRAQVAVCRQGVQADMGSHRHEFWEIVFILSGHGWHATGDTRHEVKAGDVLVINNRRTHGYEHTRELCLVNVLVRGDALREAERELGALPGFHALFTLEPVRWRRREFTSRLRLNARDLRNAVDWIGALETEARQNADGGRFLAKSWLMLLIGLLARRYGEKTGTETDFRLARLLSRIDLEPEHPFTLAEMAGEAAMSQRSFLRHFREVTGYSPADYVIRARLRQAAHLLDHGDSRLPVTEIAFRCGFNDSNYFARQFRRVMGTTPRRYRGSAGMEPPSRGCAWAST